MNVSIALLRGINVGGNNMIKMADLKTVLSEAGLQEVTTYIQSGNIVFRHNDKLDDAALTTLIQNSIRNHFGLNIPVIIRSREEWQQILNENPYAASGVEDAVNWHYMLLSKVPDASLLSAIKAEQYLPDVFQLVHQTIYLHIQKFGNTKLTNTLFDKKLQLTTTVRNHKTMMAIAEIAAKI
ncbi:DUF1697 domain-containing protein [Taibaiella sp. KBW10]|uniref:DUF1697 domain-containing protein n=1 Tax=Taibaiella sp. KBW10 TaxID=2153357 RepID=UPI000F5950F1|nr:DUF1697 domain-containing protein [Taibaiella sp. KBW10]RQO32504.1 DUF1697 domain-containing protein [Taibaiella sp. KBW10]